MDINLCVGGFFLCFLNTQAQLLILEQRYSDAEVLLEALTRLEDGQKLKEQQQGQQQSSNKQWMMVDTVKQLTRMANQVPVKSLKQETERKEHAQTMGRTTMTVMVTNNAILGERVVNPNDSGAHGGVRFSPTITHQQNRQQYSVQKQSVVQGDLNSMMDQSQYHQHQQQRPMETMDNGKTESNQRSNLRITVDKLLLPTGHGGLNGQQKRQRQPMGATNQQPQSSVSVLIDVHHQLALLYTLTNRTAEVSKNRKTQPTKPNQKSPHSTIKKTKQKTIQRNQNYSKQEKPLSKLN